MKDFRPLKPNCNLKEPDIRQILKTLGIDDVATKADLLNIWWDDIKGIPNFTQLIWDRIVELDPDKAIGIINEITADWNDDVGEPGYIKNKPTKLSLFENDERFLSEEEIEEKINEKTSEYTNGLNTLDTQVNNFKTQINLRVDDCETHVSNLVDLTKDARDLHNAIEEFGIDILVENLSKLGNIVSADGESIITPLTIKLVSESVYQNLQTKDPTVIYFIEEEQ